MTNSTDLPAFTDSALWIWGEFPSAPFEPAASGDHYRCFRRRFRLDQETIASEASLDISADTDFVAWINGIEVARGQFSDWPDQKTWMRFHIPPGVLRAGNTDGCENVLAVLVFYCGADSSTHVAGPPGLLASLSAGHTRIVSDANSGWRTAPHAAFHSGRAERMTAQTGFTFDYDARHEENWLVPGFNDCGGVWAPAQAALPRKGTLSPRPLPILQIGEIHAVRVKTQGVFFEPPISGKPVSESPADRMATRALRPEFPWRVFANRSLRPTFASVEPQTDSEETVSSDSEYAGGPIDPGILLNRANTKSVSPGEPLMLAGAACGKDGAAGRYLIIDLGEETVGLLEFEIEVSPGTVVEIAHGEHLDDGRVRMKVGGRRFADRYTCGGGRRRFQMPFRRIGARYLEVHVTGFEGARLHVIGLRRVLYPINKDKIGTFFSDDPLPRKAWDVAVRTLDLCRHEHFEDCPWREQALYAYDGRLQALYGYHAFGDYRFAEISLRLLAQGFAASSGLLPLMAPGRCPVNIPGFTLAWIGAVADHWLYSGNGTLYLEYRDIISRILDAACSHRDGHTGLYFAPSGPDIWNFYEWTPGLCGAMGQKQPNAPVEFHAAHALHLHSALRSAAWMAERAGDTAEASVFAGRADSLAQAFRSVFRDAETGLWRSTVTTGEDGLARPSGLHEFVQAFAAVELGQTLPEPLSGARTPTPCTLSSLYMLTRAVLNTSPEARQRMFRRLEETWAGMFSSGASTFWETADGARDFDFAGSLCHGWNALPAWFYHAVILGVRPLEPGFRDFTVKIHPYRFASARGRIPTPAGFIEVEWRLRDAGLHVELRCPDGCNPRLDTFPEAPVASVICNDVPLMPATNA